MKISQKRTCLKCRALYFGPKCELRYPMETMGRHGVPTIIKPLEPCPKPITVDDYIFAINNYKN
jgi:hypothetical protein